MRMTNSFPQFPSLKVAVSHLIRWMPTILQVTRKTNYIPYTSCPLGLLLGCGCVTCHILGPLVGPIATIHAWGWAHPHALRAWYSVLASRPAIWQLPSRRGVSQLTLCHASACERRGSKAASGAVTKTGDPPTNSHGTTQRNPGRPFPFQETRQLPC